MNCNRKRSLAAMAMIAALAFTLQPSKSLAQQQDTAAGKLLESVRDNQQRLETRVRNYIFTVHELDTDLNGDGREKKTENKEYESFIVGGRLITRTLSKNGKPLSADEMKKEEAKVDKQIKEAHEAQAKREAGSPEKNEISILTFLKTSIFSDPREQSVQGRRVLEMDFHPNPQFKPKSTAEMVAHKLSGAMWIDAEDHQVTRVLAKLDEKISVGLGILGSIKPGSRFEFTQKKLDEGLWMPASSDISYDARVVFFGKHGRVQLVFSNYRKFGSSSRLGEAAVIETPGDVARDATAEQTRPSEDPKQSK